MVTAAEFLKAAKVATVRKIEVLGMPLHVRGLTGPERRLLVQRGKAGDPMEAHEIVAMGACNEEGDPLFTVDQVIELARADGQVVESVAREILDASGLLEGAQEAAAKN